MKTIAFPTRAFLAAILVASAIDASASDTLTFSETLSRTTTTAGTAAGEQGRSTLVAHLALAGVDVSKFDGSTTLEIAIGNLRFAAQLSADPYYTPGRRCATILTRALDGPGSVKPLTLEAVLTWNTSAVAIYLTERTPQGGPPALADAFFASPGLIHSGVTARLSFGGVRREFAVKLTGVARPKAISLQGTGTPTSGMHLVGEGSFTVDVVTGEVTVGGDPLAFQAQAAAAAAFKPGAVFRGGAITYESSTLLAQSGDAGRKVLSVSFTNHSGEPIGMLPDGTPGGMRVVFSAFTNTTPAFPSAASATTVSTFAGTGKSGSIDGPVKAGLVPAAAFNTPQGVAVGSDGTVYVADTGNHKIRKIKGGMVSTLAGSGKPGEIDGLGTAASFTSPLGIAINPVDGALIVVDAGRLIRRVTTAGKVTKVAGGGSSNSISGRGDQVTFPGLSAVAVDGSGVIHVAVSYPGNFVDIEAFVLNPGSDPASPASYTSYNALGGDGNVRGIAADESGTTFSTFTGGQVIHTLSADLYSGGILGAGGHNSNDGRGDLATFNGPAGIVLVDGTLIVSEIVGIRLRQLTLRTGGNKFTASDWQVATLAGTGALGSTDGTGNVATFKDMEGLAADANQNIYVADAGNHKIRKVVPAPPTGNAGVDPVTLYNSDGLIPATTASGNAPFIDYPGSLAPGAATAAKNWAFIIPSGVNQFTFTASVETSTQFPAPATAVSNPNSGNLASPAVGAGGGSPGVDVSTLAGSAGVAGSLDGPAVQALFHAPRGVATDKAGNVYVADYLASTIRRISATGMVSTVAGSKHGSVGAADGTGDVATFSYPISVTVSADGSTLFVADSGNYTIRRLVFGGGDPAKAANWTVSTIAGSAAAGEGYVEYASGTNARFGDPEYVATDASGNLYVADGNRVRMLQLLGSGDPSLAANWFVSLVAGDPGASISGDGGTADGVGGDARFAAPTGIAVDAAGNLYVVDSGTDRIRFIKNPAANSGGKVSTFAGSIYGYKDGAPGAALFAYPTGIAIDSAGYLYVADMDNLRVRRISPAGTVETVAGTGAKVSLDGGGDVATFANLYGIAVDASGALYLTDDTTIRLIQRVLNNGAP